jgi:hypothetical protein
VEAEGVAFRQTHTQGKNFVRTCSDPARLQVLADALTDLAGCGPK